MKVHLTVEQTPKGFAVLYAGADAGAALAALAKPSKDAVEVCMFRAPMPYKRKHLAALPGQFHMATPKELAAANALKSVAAAVKPVFPDVKVLKKNKDGVNEAVPYKPPAAPADKKA